MEENKTKITTTTTNDTTKTSSSSSSDENDNKKTSQLQDTTNTNSKTTDNKELSIDNKTEQKHTEEKNSTTQQQQQQIKTTDSQSDNTSSSSSVPEFKIELVNLGCTIVRNLFTDEEMKQLYLEEIYKAGNGNTQQKMLKEKSVPRYIERHTGYPLATYNSIYKTVQSTIPEPKRLIERAQVAMAAVYEARQKDADTLKLPKNLQIPKLKVNNAYAQLYHTDGFSKPHIDEKTNWVVILTIGDSCDFSFGAFKSDKLPNVQRMNSGDVIICNGGKVYHGVDRIHGGSGPAWWQKLDEERFGFARCNIQFRDKSDVEDMEKACELCRPY